MRITEIREQMIDIGAAVGNAIIDLSELTTSVVAVQTDVKRDGKPVVGFGFTAYARYAQGGLMRERFIPRLLRADPHDLLDETGMNLDPFKAGAVMRKNEKPGGHGERSVAIGAIDMALWDAVAKIAEKPLHRLLAERFNDNQSVDKVSVYVGGGYYNPARDIELLQEEIKGHLDAGYTEVKIKVAGAAVAEDTKRVEAAVGILGAGEALAVDASAALDLAGGIELGRTLEPFGLRWYEDVCDPLDYETQRGVAEVYRGPMATGESLFSMTDHRNLIRYGGLKPVKDYLLMDIPQMYGLPEFLGTLDMLAEHGWSRTRVWPHGGHLFSLHCAAGLGLGGSESHYGVFAPFPGFADSTPVADGHVGLPDLPGIGWEDKADAYAVFRELVD